MSQSPRGELLDVDMAALETVCLRHQICTLRLFGSALRDDFNPQSDIDLLVEFEPEGVPGYLRLHLIAEELSACFHGRPVDLVTVGALSPRLRDRVLHAAEVLFAAFTTTSTLTKRSSGRRSRPSLHHS